MCHLEMAERYSSTAGSDEMNKTEMADCLAARTELSKGSARDAVDGVFAIIGEALADGEEVRLPGLEGHLASAPAKRLEANPQSVKSTGLYRPDRTFTSFLVWLG